LAEKPRITALNKVDALDDEERAEAHAALEAAVGGPVHLMSGVSRHGLTDVLRTLRSQIKEDRLRLKPEEEEETWQP
ncbi:MAG: GTPase ObgE, partial [Pseudomonadota bacterium]|nr:GTPase ObgE [Pseudomonadota bacterium]